MRNCISNRVQSISPSGIRKFFDLVRGRPDVISLGVGEPDFVTPWHIREAGIYAIEKGYTCYTSNFGNEDLLIEIAKFIEAHLGGRYNPKKDIIVTSGASEAVDIALRSILDPGDEVLIPEPAYVCYTPMVILAGAVPVPVPTRAERKFVVQPEDIAKAITPRTKALVLNYPNNPTGGILTRQDVERLAEACLKHDLILVSDEIYSLLTYEGDHTSFASIPELRDRLLLVHGFSKAWAMTGWRLGFLAAPESVIQAAMKVHQYVMMCASHIAQMAAVEALRHGESEMKAMVKSYNARRRLIVKGLNDAGLATFMPGGAFYAFPSIKVTGLSSEDFSSGLLNEEGVAVVPGNAFGASGEGHARCCYAASPENITEALARIGRFVRRYRREEA